VRHSLADTSKANRLLGYSPTHTIDAGLEEAMDWYISDLAK
jgi:UDP-N-acetylglucosamine 4-epimerase